MQATEFVNIETKTLNIQNSGKVFSSSLDASTFDFSFLDPNIYSPESIELIRNSVNAAAQGNFTQGNSGNLTVTATDSVNVATNGLLSTQAYGQASAGNLIVTTGQLTLQDAGTISATSFGDGFGGNIQLQANSLSLTNDGLISSRSQGANRAGNISINVRDDLQSSRGDILATSVQSGGGDINITAGDRTAPIIPTAPAKPELVEAQGWVYGAKGEVILTASASTVTPQTPFLAPPSCEGDTYGEPEPLQRKHSRSVSNRGKHHSNLLVRNKGNQ